MCRLIKSMPYNTTERTNAKIDIPNAKADTVITVLNDLFSCSKSAKIDKTKGKLTLRPSNFKEEKNVVLLPFSSI